MYIVIETIMDIEQDGMNIYKLGTTDSSIKATEIMVNDIKSTIETDMGYSDEEAELYIQALPSVIEHYIDYEGIRYYKWIILEV